MKGHSLAGSGYGPDHAAHLVHHIPDHIEAHAPARYFRHILCSRKSRKEEKIHEFRIAHLFDHILAGKAFFHYLPLQPVQINAVAVIG